MNTTDDSRTDHYTIIIIIIIIITLVKTLQIITLSVRIDESLLQLVTIRGIRQSSPNLWVKTKKKNVEIMSVYR